MSIDEEEVLKELKEHVDEKVIEEIDELDTLGSLSTEEFTETIDRIFDQVIRTRGMEKARAVKSVLKKFVYESKLEDMKRQRESPVLLMSRFEVLGELGDAYSTLGYTKKAKENFESRLDTAKKMGRDELMIRASRDLSMIYLESGRFEDAQELVKEGLERAHGSGDVEVEGRCLRQAGLIAWSGDDIEEAIGYFKNALERFEEAGEEVEKDVERAKVLKFLGDIYADTGEIETSLEWYRKAADSYEGLGREYEHVLSLMNLALMYSLQDDLERASEYYKRCVQISEENDYPNIKAWCLLNQGECDVELNEGEKAVDELERALELFEEQNDPFGLIGSRAKLASLQIGSEKLEEAEESLMVSLDLLESIQKERLDEDELDELARYEGETLELLGDVKARLDSTEKAEEYLERAYQIYDSLDLGERREEVARKIEELTKY